MTTLGPNDRREFLKIFEEDLTKIEGALAHQIEDIWDKARQQVLRETGQDELLEKKAKLLVQKKDIEEQIHQLEEALASKKLTKQQVIEMGGNIDNYGHAKGANFHGIPIDSYFEYQIAMLISAHLDLQAPAKFIRDLHKSCVREITMAGSFEQASKVYEKFYAMDFRKYGVDIPPRLDDMTKDPALLKRTHQLMVDHKATLSATCMGCGRTEEERGQAQGQWWWHAIDWRKAKGICSDCKGQKYLLDDPKIDVEKDGGQ